MRSVDEAHAHLVARDPDLPALEQLVEPDHLATRLGVPVTRGYLRYKPGTSAIALLDVGGRAAIGHVWGAAREEKRAKALRDLTDEQVLLDSPSEHLLVIDAMADRAIPALRTHVLGGRLQETMVRAIGEPTALGTARTLAHKPARRWVGRVRTASGRDVTLRVYPRQELHGHLDAHELILRHAAGSPLRLPRLLAHHRRGVLALEHLPGRTLTTDVADSLVYRFGESLGTLHAAGTTGGTAGCPGVAGTASPAIARALPEVFHGAAAVAKGAAGALRPSPATIVHGDLSLDQVVESDGRLGLIDLDRARIGVPADDLAGLLAHAALDVLLDGADREQALRVAGRIATPLLAGHASTWRGREDGDLAPRVALSLLARAGEPFGAAHPDWVRVTRDLHEIARRLVAREAVTA